MVPYVDTSKKVSPVTQKVLAQKKGVREKKMLLAKVVKVFEDKQSQKKLDETKN